ncbi:MAG: site-specific integrase [Clostridia bacterium]|nr:site-specific integrase [Clostridia bacterium]
MAKKKGARGQNEGNIRQRKDGTWEARYTANGKQKSVYAKTRPEVSAKLTKILNDINTGIFIEPTKTTVSSWLDTWFETYKKPTVKAKTLECYYNIIEKHIKPAIGKYTLKDLRPEKVQKMYNDIAAKLSPRMAELTHITLRAALEQAVTNDLIVKNVTQKTKLPATTEKERRVLTTDEQKKFMEALKGNRLEAAFILDLFSGLRVGELAALRWKNIDLENKIMNVSQTLYRVKNFDKDAQTKTRLEFGTTKSHKGKRDIPLMDEVVAVLKAHKARQAAERLKVGELYHKEDEEGNRLVFCTQIGTPLEPRKISDEFYKIIEKAEIPKANMHSLRHTFATRGLENGIELKVMQELLGHSTITLTGDVYSHVLQDKKREAIGKLKSVFNKG